MKYSFTLKNVSVNVPEIGPVEVGELSMSGEITTAEMATYGETVSKLIDKLIQLQ